MIHKLSSLFAIYFVSCSAFCNAINITVHFNGKPADGKSINSYFLPAEIDISFADENIKVTEGFIVYHRHTSKDTLVLNSNHCRNENVYVGKSIEINITEIEISNKTKKSKREKITYKEVFVKNYVEISLEEVAVINKSPGIFTCNGIEPDSSFKCKLQEKNHWKASLDNNGDIYKMEVLVIRGKRPVALQNFEGNSGEETSFKNAAVSNDIILIRAFDKDPKKVFASKVYYVE